MRRLRRGNLHWREAKVVWKSQQNASLIGQSPPLKVSDTNMLENMPKTAEEVYFRAAEQSDFDSAERVPYEGARYEYILEKVGEDAETGGRSLFWFNLTEPMPFV